MRSLEQDSQLTNQLIASVVLLGNYKATGLTGKSIRATTTRVPATSKQV